jgi:hypothetical protein
MRFRHSYSMTQRLVSLSGEDAQIVYNATNNTRVHKVYAFIGWFVIVVFVLSFLSCAQFIYELFDKNLWLAVPIVWGLMILNMYLLLLYTLTPQILVGKERTVKGRDGEQATQSGLLAIVSIALRILFVVLIAVIIAQPWLVTMFSGYIRDDVAEYKKSLEDRFIARRDASLFEVERNIQSDLQLNSAVFAARSSLDISASALECC